jgi:tRNA pseudouridine38-40 synthase
MRNLKLVLEYDGTDFRGWQAQPALRTVQGELEAAIESLTGRHSDVTAASRTDAGVHALGQVANFYTPSEMNPNGLVKGLNAWLPRDLRVLSASEMRQSFHVTLDAVSKRYRYVIDNRAIVRPLMLRHSWHVYPTLDHERMQSAARHLLGRHDFRSFETDWPNRTSSVRTIHELDVRREGDTVTIEVEADGFLYHMVRAIAGSLEYVGRGKRGEDWLGDALKAEDRRAAGPNAPSCGLFLLSVTY